MFTPKDLEHDFSCKTMSNLFCKNKQKKALHGTSCCI